MLGTVNGDFSLVCIPQVGNLVEQGSGFCVRVKVWPWCVTAIRQLVCLQTCITVSQLACFVCLRNMVNTLVVCGGRCFIGENSQGEVGETWSLYKIGDSSPQVVT